MQGQTAAEIKSATYEENDEERIKFLIESQNVPQGQTPEETADIIKKGHPPIANKVVLIDFDGTLAPFGYLFDFPEPLPGAKEFVQKLKDKGYTVGIFSSRLSRKWLMTVNQKKIKHQKYIRQYCKVYGIPADFTTGEKIPAELYIDDKAVRYTTWKEVDEWFEANSQIKD